MDKKQNNMDALWDLFVKTGLPEAYSMYKAEEQRVERGEEN